MLSYSYVRERTLIWSAFNTGLPLGAVNTALLGEINLYFRRLFSSIDQFSQRLKHSEEIARSTPESYITRWQSGAERSTAHALRERDAARQWPSTDNHAHQQQEFPPQFALNHARKMPKLSL